MDIKKINQLDSSLIEESKKIKVLSTLTWPPEAEEKFLADWKKSNPKLPTINIQPPDVRQNVKELMALVDRCDQNDPVEKFLSENALSYANAGQMLMNVGSKDFTNYSIKIYGRPDVVYKLQGISPVDSARFFLDVTKELMVNENIQKTKNDISAEDFSSWLRGEVDKFFTQDSVEVVLDNSISAKALAGAKKIKLRASAMFSDLDKYQLLYHEAFVHTATQLNGKKQLNLKSLGLGAPRTTRTQEGIAVMAELITNAIDISRLRRIALRVIAVQMALDGADFIELFKFFLEQGQSEAESVKSAQRIFRGGDVKGGVVFTKDSVYLEGIMEVHQFIRLAIRENRPGLVRNLFAGRLTIADALRLDPLFEQGWLIPPTYMPDWASDLRRLAALMAYSAFFSKITLDNAYLERAIELEEEIKKMNDE